MHQCIADFTTRPLFSIFPTLLTNNPVRHNRVLRPRMLVHRKNNMLYFGARGDVAADGNVVSHEHLLSGGGGGDVFLSCISGTHLPAIAFSASLSVDLGD